MDTALALKEPRATGGEYLNSCVCLEGAGLDVPSRAGMERGQENPGPEEAPASPVAVRKGFLEEVAAELSFEG